MRTAHTAHVVAQHTPSHSTLSARGRFAPKPLVSAEELKVLFLEVEALYAANQKFLLLLSAFPNPRTSLSLTEVFANLCNYLKAYHNYYRNHPHAVALLARLQKSNKDFDAFLTSVAVQPDVRYDLKTYLTKPIMRASLYPLLLDKMLRRIPATHIEFDGLTAVHVRAPAQMRRVGRHRAESLFPV